MANHEGGFDMLTYGINRRTVVNLDGLLAVAHAPDETLKDCPVPLSTPRRPKNDLED